MSLRSPAKSRLAAETEKRTTEGKNLKREKKSARERERELMLKKMSGGPFCPFTVLFL